MSCRIIELKDKQVVSVKDGAVIGFVNDMEINTNDGKLISVIVLGKAKGMGILSKNEEIVIPWDNIEVIGNDSILVNFEVLNQPTHKKRSILTGILFGD